MMKAVMILILSSSPLQVQKIDYSTTAECKAASATLWRQYQAYVEWSRSPDKAAAPQSPSTLPTKGVKPPDIPVPITFCFEQG